MVENKTCIRCDTVKLITEYHKDKYTKDGFRNICKECYRIRRYELEGKEAPLKKIKPIPKEGFKICTVCEKEKIINNFYKNSRSKDGKSHRCKNCDNKNSKKFRDNNKDYMKLKNSEYRLKHRESLIENCRDYYNENREKLLEQKRQYYLENKDSISKKKRKYYMNRYNRDKVYRLKENIRRSILLQFEKTIFSKNRNTSDILCCTWNDFKNHIESQFLDWMTWDNYGKYNGEYNYGWDLDHIVPISSAETEEEIYTLNHWSNFQPLCSKVNRDEKRNTIPSLTNIELM